MKQPVPTEYNGVRYRSKSEARFACWLDYTLNWNKWTSQFYYEPPWLQTKDEWIPDFLTVCSHFTPVVIEYKPSMPTPSYLSSLKRRFDELSKDLGCFHAYCLYGSLFKGDDTRGNFCLSGIDGEWIQGQYWGTNLLWKWNLLSHSPRWKWFSAEADKVMEQHRFDLL